MVALAAAAAAAAKLIVVEEAVAEAVEGVVVMAIDGAALGLPARCSLPLGKAPAWGIRRHCCHREENCAQKETLHPKKMRPYWT